MTKMQFLAVAYSDRVHGSACVMYSWVFTYCKYQYDMGTGTCTVLLTDSTVYIHIDADADKFWLEDEDDTSACVSSVCAL